RLPGQALHFTSGSLAPAIDNIRSYQPKLIAVDMLFAQTPSGMAFVARVEKAAAAESTIRFITCVDGKWVTVPRGPSAAVTAAAAAPVASTGRPAIVVPPPIVVNTRRAPRFVVENGTASLVDISVLGAQVVSHPALRPNQTIKIALPDIGEMLRVTAHVAWSTFEKPKLTVDAYYRAGIEFTDAAQLS